METMATVLRRSIRLSAKTRRSSLPIRMNSIKTDRTRSVHNVARPTATTSSRVYAGKLQFLRMHATLPESSYYEDVDDDEYDRHCETCTCTTGSNTSAAEHSVTAGRFTAPENNRLQTETADKWALPPPLNPPKYSVRRRVLPSSLVSQTSTQGTRWLLDCLSQYPQKSGWAYLRLTEHGTNQMDPAHCGLTTLVVVMNALNVDPRVRTWDHAGWRYLTEDTILKQCCHSATVKIGRAGISMDEFVSISQLGYGLDCDTKRPSGLKSDAEMTDLQTFRDDLMRIFCDDTNTNINFDEDSLDERSYLNGTTAGDNALGDSSLPELLVVSFDRSELGQTGEGHFSPVGAYHPASDRVLILDVARFKYQPYWADVPTLYRAMQPHDASTGKARGWIVMRPPSPCSDERRPDASYRGWRIESEDRKPIQNVPMASETKSCLLHNTSLDECATRSSTTL